MPRILVIGPGGQIGCELEQTLAPLGDVATAGRTEADLPLDLESPAAIEQVIGQSGAEVVVNAAAYTAVDQAESEPDKAFAVNANAPAVMARALRQHDALLIHFSTDYVFSGESRSAYTESETPQPLGVYGESKLEGERAVRKAGGRHVILRTSWVYGLRGRNFLRTVLRLASERNELRVVDDQFGAPNWSRTLADGTAELLTALKNDPGRAASVSGLYHLSATGETTWHGFASAILEAVKEEEGIKAKAVVPITTEEYPTPARRPQRSTLATGKLERDFGIVLPDWRKCLKRCLETRRRAQ